MRLIQNNVFGPQYGLPQEPSGHQEGPATEIKPSSPRQCPKPNEGVRHSRLFERTRPFLEMMENSTVGNISPQFSSTSEVEARKFFEAHNEKDVEGNNPLHNRVRKIVAIPDSKEEIQQLLSEIDELTIRNRDYVNQKNEAEETPLMIAIEQSPMEYMDVICEKVRGDRASLSARNSKGQSGLDCLYSRLDRYRSPLTAKE
ncbi:MAG: hypothetical protein C5B47_03445, partial [Verrucomicrobia bacterium]